MPSHRNHQSRPTRFSAYPPRNRPQILNQILRDPSLRRTINHNLATRNDLCFRLLSFDYATLVQETLQNLPELSPTMAMSLQPLATATDSIVLTLVRDMLDLGIEQRLETVNIRRLPGTATPLPWDSEESDPEFPMDTIGRGERTLRELSQSLVMRICNHCWEPGHPSRLCPSHPGRRQSTIRAPTPAPQPVIPPLESPSPSPTPTIPMTTSPPPLVSASPTPAPRQRRMANNPLLNGGSSLFCANCGIFGHQIEGCPYESLPSSPESRAVFLLTRGQQEPRESVEASDFPVDDSTFGRDPAVLYNSDAHDGLTD